MSEWFHVKAKFLQQADNGIVKQVKTELLIDALSFGEAEEKAFKSLDGFRDIVIDGVSRSNIAELVEVGDSDLRFKCKVCYTLADEDGGKEKRVTTYILVEASDANEAYERCCIHLKEMLVPFTIPKVEETKIPEIVHYEAKKNDGTESFTFNYAGKEPATIVLGQKRSSPANGNPVEFEIDCEIETDFQQATIVRPPADPTADQVYYDALESKHDFDALTDEEIGANLGYKNRRYAVWKMLADAGFTALESDQDEIESMSADSRPNFCEWLYGWTERRINAHNGGLIWDFLQES